MEGCIDTQSRKRRHIALAQDADNLAGYGNAVVVGSSMSDIALVKSGLLSGIENIEGLASLPSHLSLADVRLWEAAYFVNIDLPAEELVTILKVADALGDANTTNWVNKLAARVIDVDWKQSPIRDAMLCCLFCLPSHLLQLVVAACLARTSLHAMMLQYPRALHPAILSSTASQGTLTFGHAIADPVLLTLPFITVPDPGLLRIDVREPPCTYDPPYCSPLAAAALLGRAAAAHPSLTHLSLDGMPLSSSWLRSFSDCLAPGALPALAELNLAANAHPDGCAEVAACLRLLPSLTSLVVSFAHSPPPLKAPVSLSAYARLAATPASLPKLKRLSYQDAAATAVGRPVYRGYFGSSREASCAHSLLSLISAPALSELGLTALSQLPLQGILTQLSRFSSLSELEITAVRPSGRELTAVQAAEFPPLPRLTKLMLWGLSPTSAFAIASIIIPLVSSSITELSLWRHSEHGEDAEPADSDDDDEPPLAEAAARLCRRFYGALSCCTGLQMLELPYVLGVLDESDESCSDGLEAALLQLPLLTELCLQSELEMGNRVRLDGSLLGRALSRQPQLHSLTLAGMTIEPVQPVLDACARLKHITLLELSVEGVTHAHVTNLLVKLPSLRTLLLCPRVVDAVGEGALRALGERFTDVAILPA